LFFSLTCSSQEFLKDFSIQALPLLAKEKSMGPHPEFSGDAAEVARVV
jgi:hypothetical protein